MKLQQNGEWDRIYVELSDQLNELGWIDDLYDTAKERSRDDKTNLQRLLEDLKPTAVNGIPKELRTKIVAMIQASIERVVQKG